MVKYKSINDLTSDVMYEAYGKNLKELFINSALALFNTVCQASKIKPKTKKTIEIKANSLQDLLYNWLSELIALVDTEQMFFSKFRILSVNENHIKAECYGEEITPSKGGTVVKAVLYYKFKVEKVKQGYRAKFGFDI